MGKANFYYDSVRNRWVIRGKGGAEVATFNDGGEFQLAAGATRMQRIIGFVGSSAAIAAITVSEQITGTITGGGDLRIGDKIFGVPRPLIADAAKVVVNFFNVPSNGLLNVKVINVGTVAGSLAATGWDIFAVRSA